MECLGGHKGQWIKLTMISALEKELSFDYNQVDIWLLIEPATAEFAVIQKKEKDQNELFLVGFYDYHEASTFVKNIPHQLYRCNYEVAYKISKAQAQGMAIIADAKKLEAIIIRSDL